MTTYLVEIPICGSAYIEVEAESEEEAIKKAFASDNDDLLVEYELMEKIVQGNVFHGNLNEVTVEKIT